VAIKSQSVKAFLLKEIAAQRKTLFLWAPVAVGVGIVTYFTWEPTIPFIILAAMILLCAFVVAISVHFYKRGGKAVWLVTLLLMMTVGLFISGYALSHLRTTLINTNLLQDDMPPVLIEGSIEKIVNFDGAKAKRVIIKDIDIDGKNYRVRLKTYHFKGEEWAVGDRVKVKAKLIAPGGPVMPGGFDFRRKAYYEGLSAVGYTLANAQLVEKGKSRDITVEHIRKIIGDKIYSAMQPRYAAVAHALLTGERAGIKNSDTENFRISGLAHLLAISGLHIGMVAGCVFFFLRLALVCIPGLALHYPIKKWAASCAIFIAFLYMILAGATVPTVRAFIMTSLVLLAIILDRSALNLRLVAIAALFVMITTPEAVIGPSFVLSFSAVTALIVFYEVGRRWIVTAAAYKPLLRPFYYFLGVIITSLVATAATAPFSIMFFNRFAVYALVSNIAAMPLMAFIVMPAGLIGTLMIPIGMDSHFWVIMQWGIQHILNIADHVSLYPFASLYLQNFSSLETVMISFGFIIFVLWKGYLRLIGLGLMIIALISSLLFSTPALIISDDMKAILYVDKNEDNLYLFGKMNGYQKSNWLGSYGYNPTVDIPSQYHGDNLPASVGTCDDYMCRLNTNSTRVTLLFNPMKKGEACYKSDIVIASFPLKHDYCPTANVIDRFDVWRKGAMTILFHQSDYTIRTTSETIRHY